MPKMTTQRAQPIGDYMWQRGYETAFEEMKPLIEAARAYRDAIEDYGNDSDQTYPWPAMYALCEAARTLEGHVEEGRP